ncbi:hypothetical protein AbraIFM66951_006925 [Aspergillus brasiliensis]|uniref:Uncharacterized protein n=1 Tax=Aspergillus brasiliensis TaxID=319629 RepID=A0A9W5YKG5_9EURO|nr:hypothetical protein AbraCBS73388_010846 [Aspergillus brasiliensis]GKZ44669.1 hypothetical protein AbraIFM66951_006925 [Aspergillus brasiliensis]
MTSLPHELGILFGFLAACFVVMGVYVIFWRAAEFREERAQKLRRQMLLTRGIHHGRGGIGEKFNHQQHTHVRDMGMGMGLHQRNITPENSASSAMYKENEIGVALTTGLDLDGDVHVHGDGVGVGVGSPRLGPVMSTSSTPGVGSGRDIPVGGINMGSRMNVRQGQGQGGGGRTVRDEMEYGVEMDVLGFLQRR